MIFSISVVGRGGGREAEGAALEKRFSNFRDVGSNPTLSAKNVNVHIWRVAGVAEQARLEIV